MNCIVPILVVLVILLILYLLSIRPGDGRQEQMRPFWENYIAHRGFFNNQDIPENSMAAFVKAVEAGYGIELDIQLTTDDQLVVFHDETLKRMCGDERTLHQLSYEELCQLRLLGTDEKIPLFKEVLDLVDGSVPLIVEIKSEGRYLKTSEYVDQMLRAYKGIYCIESFHPMVVRWFKQNHPEVIRGQLSTDYKKDGNTKPWYVKLILTNLMLNFLTAPDFIAYNHKHKNQFSYKLCRKLYHAVNVAWTIKSEEQLAEAKDTFQVIIFDSFVPGDNSKN